MGTDHELWERAYPYAESIAGVKARQLIRKPGFNKSELPDLRQTLLMSVWVALPRYDPMRGSLEAYVAVAVTSTAAMLVRSRRRKKRGGGQALVSLDAEPGLADKARKILGGPADSSRAVGASDVREVMATLPPHLAAVAVILADKSIAETARLTGRTPREVRGDRELIREHFRRLGLAEEI